MLLVNADAVGHAVRVLVASADGDGVHVVTELRDTAFGGPGTDVVLGYRAHEVRLQDNGLVLTGNKHAHTYSSRELAARHRGDRGRRS